MMHVHRTGMKRRGYRAGKMFLHKHIQSPSQTTDNKEEINCIDMAIKLFLAEGWAKYAPAPAGYTTRIDRNREGGGPGCWQARLMIVSF